MEPRAAACTRTFRVSGRSIRLDCCLVHALTQVDHSFGLHAASILTAQMASTSPQFLFYWRFKSSNYSATCWTSSILTKWTCRSSKTLSVSLHDCPTQEHTDLGHLSKRQRLTSASDVYAPLASRPSMNTANLLGYLLQPLFASSWCRVLDETSPWISKGAFLNVKDAMLF